MNRNCQTVQHDVNLARLMHKTPKTPTKNYQTTPRKSERKRSLFEPSTPTNSEDLGPMSPLSASSVSSSESIHSPNFSPNGKFSTPPRTPTTPRTPRQVQASPVRQSPRLSTMKLDVKSSLFPHLKLNTPKSHRTPRTPRSQIKKDTPGKDMNKIYQTLLDTEQILKDLTTPPKSVRSEEGRIPETVEKEPRIIAETDTSPSTIVSLTPLDKMDKNSLKKVESSPKPTKLGIKPISTESFYGPRPEPPKARTCLFIDTLEAKDLKKRPRSPSRDSITSNRSFVSGSGHRRSTSSSGGRRSRSNNRNRPHVGVWHNIKKPKKMKKQVTDVKVGKPLISPNSRIKKMLKEGKAPKEVEAKPKRLFEEKPRVRRATKKRRMNDSFFEDDDIEDSFPDHLIKRKKLPSHQTKKDTQVYNVKNVEPDPNKKFLKYGAPRRATFTLNENVKLQLSDGVMKLQSPKKRRRLFTAKRDIIDFYDDDEPDIGIEKNVETILNRLQDDKDINDTQAKQLLSPCKVQLQKITDTQLFSMLENPATRINLVEATPTKMITEIRSSPNQKLVRNLSTLALDENERQRSSEMSLEKTGNMISMMTNILCNDNQEMDTYPMQEEEQENASPNQNKLYNLFYKENWSNLNNTISDITNTKPHSAKKKTIKVPDDQYLLDAGQKSVGIVTCQKCGVMYQAGDFADEATHNNFHNHLSDLKFTGWTNERVVGRYQDGRVLMILNSDPKPWWAKVTKIVDIVDQDLGFPEASVSALFHKTIYLFISEKAKQIVGCLIAEECREAYKMLPALEGLDVDTCAKDPSPCKVGISRIWTALSHRRSGVASRLIDCLQRTFLFGEIVPLDMVAFSVPSPSGKLLAQKVTGKQDFLVYGF